MVPVNIRQTGNERELGNKVSSMFVELPVAEADPRRSYDRVRAAAERHKADGQPLASSVLVGLTELAPPTLHVSLARLLYATRLFNVTVTNVPGPSGRLLPVEAGPRARSRRHLGVEVLDELRDRHVHHGLVEDHQEPRCGEHR